MIKTIFIDWYKTLSTNLFWEHLQNTQKLFFDKITHSLYVKNPDMINEWMRGKLKIQNILAIINKDTKISKDFLHSELVKSCQNMQFDSPMFLNLIQKIRQKGIKVVIATDNMDVFRKYTIPAMNLKNYFDDFLISYELKCLKSDISSIKFHFFHDYIKSNGLKYDETILIDDSVKNAECCKKFGMNNELISGAMAVEKALTDLEKSSLK